MAIRQVVLVGHTHHDVGYTASPRLVDRAHREMVGAVLDLCDQPPHEGPAAFRWTFEVARPVLEYWRRARAPERQRLAAACRSGRVAVTGGYLNMTQLIGRSELDGAYARLGELRAAGIHPRTEQHGDVNGIGWATVEAMTEAGLSRLVMALNPDHGRPPFRQPTGFWWEGQSGRKVFTWLSTHYGVGEEWGIVDGDARLAEAEIARFIGQLEARDDYPYDLALVHAANDNRWPTDRFVEVVRWWNARHGDVPMRTATIDQALDILESQARDHPLPTVRGEWADWWAHGHGSTAQEVAVAREARRFGAASRASLAISRLRRTDPAQVALSDVVGYRRAPYRLRSDAELAALDNQAAEALLLFDEHTWGSWETYSAPSSTFSRSHWNAKASFAYEAWDLARAGAVEGLARLAQAASGKPPVAKPVTGQAVPPTAEPASEPTAEPASAAAAAATTTAAEPAAVVFNPSGAERREVVEVEVATHRRERLLARVGPWGLAVQPLPRAPRRRPGAEVAHGPWVARLEAGAGGVTSLVDSRTGREWVDGAFDCPLGALVAEAPRPGHPMFQDPKRFRPEDPGPVFDRQVASASGPPEVLEGDGWAALVWQSALTPAAAGQPQTRARSTLTLGGDWLGLDVELAKPPVLAHESLHVAFPFRVDGARFLIEGAGAVFAAEAEQLPDTCKDWYSIQQAVGVSGAAAGVLWASLDAPLVQVGDFQTGKWSRRLAVKGGLVTSWLANNLHFTNFQASQDASGRYRYRFGLAEAPLTHADVRRFGQLFDPGLQAATMPDPPSWEGPSGLTVEPAEAVAGEPRLEADGRVVVRLRNLTGRRLRARAQFAGPHGHTADAVLEPHAAATVELAG
ncbi:MAG: hypothetical protein LBG60_06685 [Bifidobacteriaceae bacterium]|jgi:hypothetical protein|nr:hypothetical protein [Bifidobacteriaceae bacterium]